MVLKSLYSWALGSEYESEQEGARREFKFAARRLLILDVDIFLKRLKKEGYSLFWYTVMQIGRAHV